MSVYLPQSSSRQASAARYDIGDGLLRFVIEADQQPWCPDVDGEVRVSSLQTGVFAGNFDSQDDGKKGRDRVKGVGVRFLCMTVQDIDTLAESIKARGGTLVREPMDQLWGVRDLEVVDPDGFQITIYKTL